MTETTSTSSRAGRFRSAIAAFIDARREAKLKGNDADAQAASRYDYHTWLADAARRAGQIHVVTHVLKATHSAARGSSLHVPPDQLPSHAEVGSHVLGSDYVNDVTADAAALYVLKLLQVEIEGRQLQDWARDGDADLLAALHPDPELAGEWLAAFGDLVRTDAEPVSHQAAKQVYWLVGNAPTDDGHYHLLQPMFSSSLAHVVHAEIQEARFGEANTLARQAYRAKQSHDDPYRDYRGLVARKLGGTNPQNISQLNTERGGINYLLSSLPPRRTRERARRLLNLDSAIDERFAYFDDVRRLVGALIAFLQSDPEPNIHTRNRRKTIEQALGTQLAMFAASVQATQEPGWTRHADCRLPLCEQLWLDPERTELPVRQESEHPAWEQEDLAFNTAFGLGGWPDEVAARFAQWINAQLRDAGLMAVSDAEYAHWARQAIVDATWPSPLQRRASTGALA